MNREGKKRCCRVQVCVLIISDLAEIHTIASKIYIAIYMQFFNK